MFPLHHLPEAVLLKVKQGVNSAKYKASFQRISTHPVYSPFLFTSETIFLSIRKNMSTPMRQAALLSVEVLVPQ